MNNITNRNEKIKIGDIVTEYNIDDKFIPSEPKYLVLEISKDNWAQGEVTQYSVRRIRKDKKQGKLTMWFFDEWGNKF